MEKMCQRYQDQVNFVAVYIREAHPTDGWRMQSNDRAGIAVAQPTTTDERRAVAATCGTALQMSMPLVVDAIDDRVGKAYSAFPDRLYLVDRAGRIAYRGGRGPFGYQPRELEQQLILMLLQEHCDDNGAAPAAGKPGPQSAQDRNSDSGEPNR